MSTQFSKFILSIVLPLVVFSSLSFVMNPHVVAAADENTYAIPLPCEGVKIVNGEPVQDCDFNDLVQLVSNVISFLLLLSITIATFAIAWCGWKILWAGSSTSEISEAKKMLVKILWGFFFALTAWLIVKLIVEGILVDGSYTSFF